MSAVAKKQAIHGAHKKQQREMNLSVSKSAGRLSTLKTEVHQLQDDIKADVDGLGNLGAWIAIHEARKKQLQESIEINQEFIDHFDKNFQPFMDTYDNFLKNMGTLYEDAKAKHLAGLHLLMEHFQYHPAYKRWSDTMTAVPFKPK